MPKLDFSKRNLIGLHEERNLEGDEFPLASDSSSLDAREMQLTQQFEQRFGRNPLVDFDAVPHGRWLDLLEQALEAGTIPDALEIHLGYEGDLMRLTEGGSAVALDSRKDPASRMAAPPENTPEGEAWDGARRTARFRHQNAQLLKNASRKS